ncbi:MAG: cytochrome c biogenesis protein CcsA [Verrucomicrobiota bacterium]
MLFGLEDRQWIFIATVVFAITFILGTYSVLKLQRKTASVYTLGLVTFGWVLQTIGLYARGLEYGGCPLANNFELVQFTVWSAIVLYIFVGPAFRVSLLGVLTSGFAAALSILSLTFPGWDSGSREAIFGDNPWIETHAALALFSYGVFGIQALISGMYLSQSRSLKTKELGGLFRFMPSIVELLRINQRLLLIGLVILTVSLGIGRVHWADENTTVDALKLTATIAVWVAYGIIYFLRVRKVLSSKRFAWTSIAVFAIALLSLEAVSSDTPPTEPPAATSIENELR